MVDIAPIESSPIAPPESMTPKPHELVRVGKEFTQIQEDDAPIPGHLGGVQASKLCKNFQSPPSEGFIF